MRTIDDKNIIINIKQAEKSTQLDSYDGGCDPDTYTSKQLALTEIVYPSILGAFKSIVKDNTITANQITTMDSNIYCDTKSGETRTVKDNMQSGLYRCSYNRTENEQGRKPSAQENEDFKAGKIDLKLADYDIYFTIQIGGFDEKQLADFVGVSNWRTCLTVSD